MSRLFWIDTPAARRLAIMARPRADDWLEDEIAGWRASGLERVVSLLEPGEVADLGLQREAALCAAAGIELVSFPIPDRGVPASRTAALALARTLAAGLVEGRSIAVHCRAGIGRSSLIAACALVCLGLDGERAFALIKEARGLDVPDTEEQREWVMGFEGACRADEHKAG